ncbi:hypothetical protein cypCar_00000652 [Cyprinus carpio]|nr:hypothetical protein cypCar_00000652 [Cyprinus carpio]
MFEMGVKWNMKHLYQRVSESQFSHCLQPLLYCKLLFTLCFFHSVILERKKFLQLSWSIVYTFDGSDFELEKERQRMECLSRGCIWRGGGWDKKASCLVEAKPLPLVCPMPSIHFRPVESLKRVSKTRILSMCYHTWLNVTSLYVLVSLLLLPCVVRWYCSHSSFVMAVDLRSGAVPYDHWIKRGTTLLMSFDN